ncbi:LysR family transcriptional regulator [Agaribacter flavus]|uniref:LysR family transcriptional regulator n=1 Tax=Agaribacter flavus TaxID=1902781 RepID=A0ABV7FL80_9ALTE
MHFKVAILHMDWNSLKILTVVDKAGSMSGASRVLGVNYTTIFRRLESLEKELGGKLFVRGSKGYVATPLAKEVLLFANSMLKSSEEIERHIVGREFLPSGAVKITAPFNIANRYLPAALTNISKKYPDIHFEILSSNDAFNLNTRVADIAIRATNSPPEHLVGRKAASIPWALFASECFIGNCSTLPTFETLANYPLIGATGSMLDLSAFTWLEATLNDAIVVRCDELTAMSNYAEAGFGIALLPRDQKRKGLIEIAELSKDTKSDLWILYHPDLKKTERVRIVAEYLFNYFNNISFES